MPAREHGPATPPDQLRSRTLASVFWILASNVVRTLVLFLLPAGLAWLSGPVELGIAQIAYGVYAVALPCVTLGVRAAVVQWPQPTQAFLSSVFYLNLFAGVAAAVVLGIGAPWIANVGQNDPSLVTAIRWIGAACAVSAITVVPTALLAREMAFRAVSLVSIAAAGAGAAAGVVAILETSALAAVGWAAGTYLVVNALLLWGVGRWRPSLVFDTREARAALQFGLTASLATFAGSLAGQIERFAIAGLFGPAALGHYGAARNLNRDALRNLMVVSDNVLLPGLAMLQADPGRARAYYLHALRYECVVFAPVAVFVLVFARDLVLLVYGPAWLDIVPLVQVLTPMTLFTITNHTIGAVFLSHGRPGLQLRWTLLSIVLAVAWVVLGAPWGLLGAVTALSVLDGVGWVISHRMANAVLALSWPAFLRNLATPAAAASAFGAALLVARRLGDGGTPPSAAGIIGMALMSVCLYAGLLYGLDRALARDLWQALGDIAREPLLRRGDRA